MHRLDKDTTGLMMVARTLESQTALVAMLSSREVTREYDALVYGDLRTQGTVDKPVGRHHKERTKMTVRADGRTAVTHYAIVANYGAYTHVRLRLETGRTHQIRVHMQSIGYPLVGDVVYGGTFRQPAIKVLESALRAFPRQALHARRLSFLHPVSEQSLSFEVPIPEDLSSLIQEIEAATQ